MRESKHITKLIFIGGGLASLVTAWRCLYLNEQLEVTIVEAKADIAGNHTWSFNLTDIDEGLYDWFKPFIAHSWTDYDVHFPQYSRRLNIAYASGNSDSLRACIAPYIHHQRLKILTGKKAISATAHCVTLEGGDMLRADQLFDGRGFIADPDIILGYQKFVGHVIETSKPHGVERPIIMDAAVEQLGGYRFVYCLPYSPTKMLVEDTYYTDGRELNSRELSRRINGYISRQGWGHYQLVHEEEGVLPITLAIAGQYKKQFSNLKDQPISIGLRGGYFHAITGYSLPEAVRNADLIAKAVLAGETDLRQIMQNRRAEHYKTEHFSRFLNRMLFKACAPEHRYRVLQRFYKLPEGLIKRFYANQLRWDDKARILTGKPPVAIGRAMRAISERNMFKNPKLDLSP